MAAPAQAARSMAPAVGGRTLPRETPQQAARRLALITLVDRVADVVDLGPLKHSPIVDETLSQQIDRAVREQAKAMREEGEAPEGTDLELLARDALRELVGLGPIGPLLEDEETLEIHVSRPDYVLAIKNGQPTLADPSFTSEEALGRVVARLAHQSGESWHEGELVIERRLARGAHMVAIAPPAASTWVLTVRKRRRVESSIEEMVRSGTMSRSIASFLEACLAARANVLVVGSGTAVVAATLGALASAAPAGERVAVLQDADEIAIAQAQVVALSLSDHGSRGEESVRAATRLGADRLVVASLAGSVAAAIIDAIGEGCEGVLAGVGAPSLRHGLARLASQVALARPGASIEASREAVGESFDVAVEVVRSADGRQRVLRVAELAGSDAKGVVARDLFVLSADGTGEGAYVATGAVPRLANDFAARGVKLDGGLFKRK
jgi:pilus assembly protein CpaF